VISRHLCKVEARVSGWQFGQGTALGQVKLPVRNEARSVLGDEAAAHPRGVWTELLGPDSLQVDAYGWKNRNMQNRKQCLGDPFGRWEIESNSSESEVHDAGALNRLVGQDGVGIGARH